MSTTKGILLCAAVLVCTAAEAHAHTERRNTNGLSSRIYATFAHCSPPNRMDPLQPGEIAIMEQDRGYREGIGLPRDAGECW